MKDFKVNINTNLEYCAEDKEDCLKLVQEDFEVDENDIIIEEIIGGMKE